MVEHAEPVNVLDQVARLRSRITRERRQAMTRDLAPYLREVAAAVADGTHPGRRYWGDCYRRAAGYILARTPPAGTPSRGGRLTLAHGVCCRGNMVWGHAWVVLPYGLVFDGVRQQFYDLDGYCHVLQAVAESTYSPAAMLERIQVTQHYGPWHRGLLGPAAAGRLDEVLEAAARSL